MFILYIMNADIILNTYIYITLYKNVNVSNQMIINMKINCKKPNKMMFQTAYFTLINNYCIE